MSINTTCIMEVSYVLYLLMSIAHTVCVSKHSVIFVLFGLFRCLKKMPLLGKRS